MIQSTPEHNVGDQKMTYRMAANAIWNKLNFAMSLLKPEQQGSQLDIMMREARALADSIVHDEHSDEDPVKLEAEFKKAANMADDLAYDSGHICR